MFALIMLLSAALTSQPRARAFEATYTATLKDIPSTASTMTVWIPLPVSRGAQEIANVTIDSPYEWHRATDPTWGNEYAYATVPRPADGTLAVHVRFSGVRHEITPVALVETKATHAELERNLLANRMVTLSPRIRKLADEITAGKTTPMDQAHAIYDYLVTTMKYDKVTPGWGNGDSERACDVHAGNCTDFHSLFMSLARAKGIPSRFVIGFPMPASDSVVSGYHCWAEFYIQGRGWIPVDPSEGSKGDAARRAYLFGNLDPDRVQFTMGRDLKLNPATAEPLNYFIYPHAESDGQVVGVPSVSLDVHDRQASASKTTP